MSRIILSSCQKLSLPQKRPVSTKRGIFTAYITRCYAFILYYVYTYVGKSTLRGRFLVLGILEARICLTLAINLNYWERVRGGFVSNARLVGEVVKGTPRALKNVSGMRAVRNATHYLWSRRWRAVDPRIRPWSICIRWTRRLNQIEKKPTSTFCMSFPFITHARKGWQHWIGSLSIQNLHMYAYSYPHSYNMKYYLTHFVYFSVFYCFFYYHYFLYFIFMSVMDETISIQSFGIKLNGFVF